MCLPANSFGARKISLSVCCPSNLPKGWHQILLLLMSPWRMDIWNVHNCDDHSSLDFKSAVQCMKHFIYHFTSILHGMIRTHKWPAPNVSGFIAQLVRASHQYREVTGSNPIEVLAFPGFYTQLLKIAFITAMIIAHLYLNCWTTFWSLVTLSLC